jgi:hypothetical protein
MGKNSLVIVGGGASGLVAAIVAARAGAKVTLLERMNRIGKKILATGNGRCNLTNMDMTPKAFHGSHPEFVLPALNRLDVENTLLFFEELGIYPRIEKGYVYPYSNQATSVLDVLKYEVERLGVNIHCEEEVTDIIMNKNQYVVLTRENKYYGAKVILCSGGQSTPELGSNGSGFDMARKLGHKVIKPYPGLVQLKAQEAFLKQIKGVKVLGHVHLYIDEEFIKSEAGEILFTDYGLSGIAILQLSRYVGQGLSQDNKIKVVLDMMPEYETEALNELFINRFAKMPHKNLEESLIGLFNKRLIPVIIKEANCSLHQPISQLTKDERNGLIQVIKTMSFEIIGTQTWSHSQVTTGGVSTDEVDPNTLESKLHPNLYFAGEVLDIDGDCGGYNLQWAWSSAYLAAESATLKG